MGKTVEKQNTWVKILFSLIVFIIFFSLLELSARLYAHYEYGSHNRGMYWKFKYEPFLMFNEDWGDASFDKIYPPKEDKFRVVILGGSIANRIPNELVIEELENIIQKEVEVINLGRHGYIVNQARIALLLYGIKLDPDLLITIDGSNDIVMMTKSLQPGMPYENQFIDLAVNHPTLNFFFGIIRNSQFCNSLLKLKERKVEKEIQKNIPIREETIKIFVEGLQSISIIAQGLGIPHVMVLHPYLYMRKSITEREKSIKLEKHYEYRKKFMTEMFTSIDSALTTSPFTIKTNYVNGTKAFDNVNYECFKDAFHLTKKGNQLLVQYIFSSDINYIKWEK